MDTIIGDDGIDDTLLTFGNTVAGMGQSRHSFENSASFEINRKKRRLSGVDYGLANDTANDANISSESFSSATGTYTSQAVQSPWETRRMKADLIEARSRITVLKKQIDLLNTGMETTQLRNQHTVSSLEKELKQANTKVADMEKHLLVLRKREHKCKEELVKSKNQFSILKQTANDRQFELEQALRGMEQKHESDLSELQSEIRELNLQVKELEQQLTLVQNELDTTREINDTLQAKASAYDQTKRKLEETADRLSEAESRVKALEYEVGSHEDWKNLSKVSTARLANVAEMERDNVRLKEELKNIRELIGNKLLLEEQVSNLQTRLEHYEKKDVQTAALEVRLKDLEQELLEWRKLGKDYSPQGASEATANPKAMRSLIVEILQKDVVLTSEQSAVLKERTQMQRQIQELQSANELLEKHLAEHKRSLKHNYGVMHRAQKKMQLVVGERDCLKQVIESYEKDLTMNQSASTSNADAQMRARVEMLEKTLTGYQELCQKLESEVQSSKTLPDMAPTSLTSEHYEKLRKEIDQLRMHNDRLQRRKDELELEVQNHTLRGAGPKDPPPTTPAPAEVEQKPLLGVQENPANRAYAERDAKLRAEIERLRSRIRKLEEDNGDLSECLLNTTNTDSMTLNVHAMNSLRTKLQTMEAKYQNSKEVFRQTSKEFREVCIMLFGYRLELVNRKNYRLSSQFAESPDEYLNFRLNDDGTMLNMLETDYSKSLHELIQTQLKRRGSLPAFLASLTLELFNRATIVFNPSHTAET